MRATSDLYVLTSWLEGFVNINEIGSKILINKLNSLMNEAEVKRKLKQLLEDKVFGFKIKELEQFKVRLKEFYADNFTDHNINQAELEFDEMLNGSGHVKDNYIFYFCIGVLITILFYFPVTYNIPYGILYK